MSPACSRVRCPGIGIGHHRRVLKLDCPFCGLPEDRVIAELGPCVALWSKEPPSGSLMVIPKSHRKAPWDLTPPEWTATQDLLGAMMNRLRASHKPDGWNVGWNVGRVGGQSVEHAHCHLVPRYRDERYAGRGIRWWIKRQDVTSTGAIPLP